MGTVVMVTLAVLASLAVASLTQVASMWFVYGLWPQNWTAYVIFLVIGIALSVLAKIIDKSGDDL